MKVSFFFLFTVALALACSSAKSPFLIKQQNSYDTMVKANNLAMEGEYKGALTLYERACLDFTSLDDLLGVVNCHINRGLLYLRMGKKEEAISQLSTGRDISRDFGLKGAQGQVLMSLAMIRIQEKEFAQAQGLLDEAINLLLKYSQEKEDIFKALAYRGFVFIELNKLSLAKKDLEQAKGSGNENTLSYVFINLARLDLIEKNYGLARENALAALKLDQDQARSSYIVYDYIYLTRIAKEDKKLDQAILYARRGLNISLAGGFSSQALEITDLLLVLYEQKGEKAAVEYLQKVRKKIEQDSKKP